MLNGEFIIMRNLRVAVIKFALAFIESAITHPSESEDARLSLASCSVLQLAMLIQMCYLMHFNTCVLGASWCQVLHYPQATRFIYPHA